MFRYFARTALRSPLVAAGARSTNAIARPTMLISKPSVLKQVRSKTTIGKIDKPTYALTFTCKACDHRSSHLISKQAYHNGTVLVQCPSCKNRHLIADHLKIFSDERITVEDILAAKGQTVTKAKVDLDNLGDIELEPEDLKALEKAKSE